MPWVYKLDLVEFRDAATIQSEWEARTPGNGSVNNRLGGVTVSGRRAVIVSKRHNPEHENMADLAYVEAVSEHKEIPADPDKPVELGHGFAVDPR